MEPEIKPVIDPSLKAIPKGRLADAIACAIAALAAGLALITAILFFAGFVENDSHFGAITSAFSFIALLAAFAVIPPAVISGLAWRAYKNGGTKRSAAFCLLMSLPWVALSALCLAYTPLPIWISGLTLTVSFLLTLWAFVGLFLER